MRPRLVLALIFVCCFAMATDLDGWFNAWNQRRNESASVMQMLIGDSRRLFANHFFAKADAYFHSGYYPTIFDTQNSKGRSHLEEAARQTEETHGAKESNHESEAELDFLGRPRDWIEAMGRSFFPTTHSHLERNGDEREMLPWFRLAAELDPQQVEIYTSAAYVLRNRLGKMNEAEQFLREGLRQNPGSPEILLDLGRMADDYHKDLKTAQNLWELAFLNWRKRDALGLHPDPFIYEQILGHLTQLEEERGNWKQLLLYLEELKKVSPDHDLIERRIAGVQAKNLAHPAQ